MTSYSQSFFKPEHLALFRVTAKIIDALPQVLPHDEFRCHEIARVVGTLLDLEVIDGIYAGKMNHSWLMLGKVEKETSCLILIRSAEFLQYN